MDASCHILIVEDHDDCGLSLKTLLTLNGYDAYWVQDARSALDLPFDPMVVLLDLALPGMDGFEVARRMKAKAPHIHIFAVTGYAGIDITNHCHEVGIDLHLVKPLDIELLFKELDRVCRH